MGQRYRRLESCCRIICGWKRLLKSNKSVFNFLNSYSDKGDVNSLIELCRGLDKTDDLEFIEICAKEFKKLK